MTSYRNELLLNLASLKLSWSPYLRVDLSPSELQLNQLVPISYHRRLASTVPICRRKELGDELASCDYQG